jgi:hypothetical protein
MTVNPKSVFLCFFSCMFISQKYPVPFYPPMEILVIYKYPSHMLPSFRYLLSPSKVEIISFICSYIVFCFSLTTFIFWVKEIWIRIPLKSFGNLNKFLNLIILQLPHFKMEILILLCCQHSACTWYANVHTTIVNLIYF